MVQGAKEYLKRPETALQFFTFLVRLKTRRPSCGIWSRQRPPQRRQRISEVEDTALREQVA